MKQLNLHALTDSGHTFDIDLPLHPNSGSAERISELVGRLLDTLSEAVHGVTETKPGLSHGDVLQALAMATAVRARMVDADPKAITELAHALVEQSLKAVHEATPSTATRH